MDRGNLGQVNALYGENAVISQALASLNSGEGKITSMTIGPDNPVDIDTTTWTYPPQMVDQIRTNLQARQAQITQELTQLGLTGVGAPTAAPQAAGRVPRR